MNPHFTAFCVTFARQKYLEQSIACFLNQKYDGEAEMLVLNTCPEQTLVGDFKGVKIINCRERPKSLGAARNLAIEHAEGTHLAVWDDDDAFSDSHLSNFAAGFEGGHDWVHLDRQFFCEKFKISKIVSGQMPCFAFTKKAWKEIGGYSEEFTVGEDRNFIGRLTSSLSGRVFSLKDDEISFFYGWDNGSPHVSGLGVDRPGLQPAHERIADDFKRRVSLGMEKTGEIHLNPVLEHDPKQMVKDFMDSENQKHDQKLPVCIVMLGRYGDLAGILPICKHIAETYSKPHLMVAREFASILDGVSYVIPEIVDTAYDRLDGAMQTARRKFQIILRAQIWGRNHTQEKLTPSYCQESWRELGFLKDYHNPDFRLVFDRRDKRREEQLVAKLKTDKPMLLVNLKSISSPFPFGNELMSLVRHEFSDQFNIVDLTGVQCERIYDLVSLFDVAAGILTADTSTVHLATASNVKVILLSNPLPWAGTVPRCNCVERMSYDEAKAAPERVLNAICEKFTGEIQPPMLMEPIKSPARRRIFHSVDVFKHENIDTMNRVNLAKSSWDLIYATGKVLPSHFTSYPRDAREIGEKRALPYLRDMLSKTMEEASDEDLIFFSNDDNILHTDLPAMVMFYASVYDVVSSQRIDLHRALPMRILNPVEMDKNNPPHFGRDLFAFKKSWLVKHWDDIGEYILGASSWDVAMTAKIRLYHGIKSDRQSFLRHIFPAECPRGYVFHLQHASRWAENGYQDSSAANQWNNKIWREWASRNLPDLQFNDKNCI